MVKLLQVLLSWCDMLAVAECRFVTCVSSGISVAACLYRWCRKMLLLETAKVQALATEQLVKLISKFPEKINLSQISRR